MSNTNFPPLFPGMSLEAAERFAQDHASARGFAGSDPMAEMGWACTLVPEESGGVGGSMADLGSVVEGLASHGVHLPVIERCAIAPLLLQASPVPGEQWLAQLCEGTARVAPLVALSSPLSLLPVQGSQLDIGFALSGEVRGVDVTLPATHYIVPAQIAAGEVGLFLVASERLGPPGAVFRTMEGRRAADFRLAAFAVPAGACLARGDAAREALVRAERAALLLTAVDTVAALAALLQQTITHLQERRQFGVALSTFQVLRHRTSDMYVRYLAAKGLVVDAFQACEADAPAVDRTLRLMKLSLAETARACAEAAIQMHGGMGVSEEVLATRLAQRLIASEFRYGDRLTLGTMLLSTPSPAGADAAPRRQSPSTLARSA